MPNNLQLDTIRSAQIDFDELSRMVDTDPINLINMCRGNAKMMRIGVRRYDWKLATALYAGAFAFRDPDRFKELLEHEYFDHRIYSPDPDDLLRLVFLIGTDAAPDGPTYNKACGLAAKLKPFFDQDVEPLTVLATIEAAKGFKQLGSPEDWEEPEIPATEWDNADSSDFDDDALPTAPPVTGSRQVSSPVPPSSPQRPRGKAPDGEVKVDRYGYSPEAPPLRVAMDFADLMRVLNLPVGGYARLTVKHLPSDRPEKRIEAISVEIVR